MGLDAIELVMEVEETFGIAIPDRDAETLITVGGLYRYVLARLDTDAAGRPPSTCPSLVAFHRLRRALVEGLGVDRGAVRPATPMGSLVASRDRKAAWRRLGRALGSPLPGLVRPAALVYELAAWIVAAVVAVVAFEASAGMSPGECAATALPLLVLLGVLAAMLSAPFARRVPPSLATVRDAVGAIILDDYKSNRRDAESRADPGAVWLALRSLIVEQLGVRPEDVTEGASFVDDLGLG